MATTGLEGSPTTRRVRLRRVLVVDPDAPWAEAVGGALALRGFVPVRLPDAEQARWRIREGPFDLALVSTAVAPPALELLLRDLRTRVPNAPVVLMVAADQDRGGEAWQFLRVARTVRRPCRVQDVADAIWAILGKPGADAHAGA
jgi:DNA-binding NtrC family response regulator